MPKGTTAAMRWELGQVNYKRWLAYKCLGLNPTQVKPVPFLRGNLRRIARLIHRGTAPDERTRPFDYLGFSYDPDARKVWDLYCSVPKSYRRLLPPEAFCQAAGVSASRILEIIAAIAVRQGADASTVVASILHLSVVQKTVDRALDDNNSEAVKYVEMLHKAAGFLPTWGWKGLFAP